MKFSSALIFACFTNASPNIMGGKLAETVRRNIGGDWVSKMMPRQRRDEIDGRLGFKPLAAMILYMTGFDEDNSDPEVHNNFEAKMGELEDRYTNYGCYCWIDGVGAGVTGGGKTKDMSDHHCKELYRCYKCANIDYAKNYTDVSYNVDFTSASNDDRQLDCTVNSKQDAENICECDKRFAANIAATQQSCQAGAEDNYQFGAYCMNEQWRTTSGNVLGTSNSGTFKPKTQCEKNFHDHTKDKCCGIYPNRYPYDSNFKECCQTDAHDGDANPMLDFSLTKSGECEGEGGTVVVSEEGNPHSYVAAGSN